jgi:lipid-binding SYLF domain-containing protein
MVRHLILVLSAACALTTAACTTSANVQLDASSRRHEIEAVIDPALSRLYEASGSAHALVAQAKGVLVVPRVVSAGLLVGGSRGLEALRVDGRSVGYYSATGASFGLLAGAESKDVFLLFMTEQSLQHFRSSSGWTAGVDASVALADLTASGRADSADARADVIGFVVSNGGLMANLSVEGTRLSRLDL